jgi:hypothetical protein
LNRLWFAVTRLKRPRQGYLDVLTYRNELRGAIMTKRKPKPTFSPLIEWPTEQPQLEGVTVEHEEPAGAGETWHVETELPVDESWPQRGEITLH